MAEACGLCGGDLKPEIADSAHWDHILNKNQDFLGKSMIVLKRHLTSVAELEEAEWSDLRQQVKMATEALKDAFSPVHFNYAFLQNQDRHVHLHVIPRYSEVKVFEGEAFPLTDFPRPGEPNYVSHELLEKVAQALRKGFQGNGAAS